MKSGVVGVAVVLISVCIVSTAHAMWVDHPSANVSVCSVGGWQALPTSVPDGAGGAIIVWPDSRIESNDLYAQRINADGECAWAVGGVRVTTALGSQYPMTVAPDGMGGALVAWQDGRSGEGDIYAQRVSSTGDVLWQANGVPVCTAAGWQLSPSVVSDGAGGAIICWQDNRSAVSAVYAQRINASGVAAWATSGVRIAPTVSSQIEPAISVDGSGGAYIAWQEVHASSDVYALRIGNDGGLIWSATAVCGAVGDQYKVRMVAAGDNKAVLVWQDFRSNALDLYAQKLIATGGVEWAANGVPVCTGGGSQTDQSIAADSSGGVFVTWSDSRNGGDIYAQHLSATGTTLWTEYGVSICTESALQQLPSIVSSGTGSAIVCWKDGRAGNAYDVYAQRVDASGEVAWQLGGVALSLLAHGADVAAALSADGAGGAIAAFDVLHSSSNYDIAAQRILPSGRLGDVGVEPLIVGARDIPNDQGGHLKLSWNACWLDVSPTNGVTDYRVWRSVPPNAVADAARGGAAAPEPAEGATAGFGQRVRTSLVCDRTIYWELVATQIARRLSGYSLVIPTTSDSVAGSNPPTLFMVEARSSDGVSFWDSPVDSGYSVDNLSPPAPSPFIARYDGSDVVLHWLPSRAPDFAEFRLYRGGAINFVPGPSNLVFAGRDTGLVDRSGLGGFYKLAAVDVHGNVGHFAMVSPTSPTAALASFVSSEWTGTEASLTWYGAGLSGLRINVYRTSDGFTWEVLAQVVSDEEGFVRFRDASVEPRGRYTYKLGILDEDTEQFAGYTMIEIPGARLSIQSIAGNPVRGEALNFVASLPRAGAARARVLDLAGRVVSQQTLQTGMNGHLTIPLSGSPRLRPGIYLLELSQAGERAVSRFVYLK